MRKIVKKSSPKKEDIKVGQRFKQIHIERISHDFRGIVHLKGHLCLVAGALVDDVCDIEITQVGTKSILGKVLQIEQNNQHRMTPVCPHFDQCGGCDAQHVTVNEQVALKEQLMVRSLNKLCDAKSKQAPTLQGPSQGYRSRIRLHVEKGQLGFLGKGSHQLVEIQSCAVAQAPLNRLLAQLQTWFLAHKSEYGKLSGIELLVDDQNQLGLVLFDINQTSYWQTWFEKYQQDFSLISMVAIDNSGKHHPFGKRLQYAVNDVEFAYYPGEFTQVNREINQKMIHQAIEWLQIEKTDNGVDLFSGMGNFTLPLAKQCTSMLAAELSKEANVSSKLNADKNNISNCEFITSDLFAQEAYEWLNGQPKNWLVLDPPRSGAFEFAKAINNNKNKPKIMLYVSCHLATMTRDLELLSQSGYSIKKYGLMDMFPHTYHGEYMVLLKLEKDKKHGKSSRRPSRF